MFPVWFRKRCTSARCSSFMALILAHPSRCYHCVVMPVNSAPLAHFRTMSRVHKLKGTMGPVVCAFSMPQLCGVCQYVFNFVCGWLQSQSVGGCLEEQSLTLYIRISGQQSFCVACMGLFLCCVCHGRVVDCGSRCCLSLSWQLERTAHSMQS
jgi:hypothetical protein